MSPASFIATHLLSNGFSNIFVGTLPNNKDACIALFDDGGSDPNPRWNRDTVNMRVLVRGDRRDYSGTYLQAKQLKDYLLGANSITNNGTIYSRFLLKGDIAFANYDDNEQPIFFLRVEFVIEGVTEGNRSEIV